MLELTDVQTGFLGLILMIVLLLSGLHVGAALLTAGLLGLFMLRGTSPALGFLGFHPYNSAAVWGFAVVPMFILMGEIANKGGFIEGLFDFSNKLVGRFTGGLAAAVCLTSAGLAAVTGSSVAATTAMTRIAVPHLKQHDHDIAFATALIAASGSMAVLIPPSVMLVIYGILTEQPIGQLLMAGFLPGLLEVVAYTGVIYYVVRKDPSIAPRGPRFPISGALKSAPYIWPALSIMGVGIGGLYLGVFTPTEAGAVAAAAMVVMSFMRRRLGPGDLADGLWNVCLTVGLFYLIIIGAFAFALFLDVSGLPRWAVEGLATSGLSKWVIYTVLLALFIGMGTLMDAVSIMAITLPVVFPLILKLGFDPIWFGVIMVKMSEVGVLTPPFGLNVFAVKAALPPEDRALPVEAIYRKLIPFLVADLVQVAILTIFPGIVLFLPRTMLQ